MIDKERLKYIYENSIYLFCMKKVSEVQPDLSFKLGMASSSFNRVLITSKEHVAKLQGITAFDIEELISVSNIFSLAFNANHKDITDIDSASNYILELQNLVYKDSLLQLKDNEDYIHIAEDTPEYLIPHESTQEDLKIIFCKRT